MNAFQQTAAIFDLDKSLLDGNAGVLFTRFLYLKGAISLRYRRQIPGLIYRYVMGQASEAELVEFGSRCKEGCKIEEIAALAASCFQSSIRGRITREGQEAIRKHLLRGHLVVLASGSPQPIVSEVGRYLGAHVALGSRVREEAGIYTGEIDAPLCFQEGKRQRVRSLLDELRLPLENALLYSDSPADLPLFEAVGRPIVVNPLGEFVKDAKQRGWEIRHWKRRIGKGKGDPIQELLLKEEPEAKK